MLCNMVSPCSREGVTVTRERPIVYRFARCRNPVASQEPVAQFGSGFNVETASDSPVWHPSETDIQPGD